MGLPAARLGDMHMCPMATPAPVPVPHVGGPVVGPGQPTVLIAGMVAARCGDMLSCCGPPDAIAKGSATVFIGGLPAARMGDTNGHGGAIAIGAPTVLIGDGGGGSGSGSGAGAVGGKIGAALAVITAGVSILADGLFSAFLKYREMQAGEKASGWETFFAKIGDAILKPGVWQTFAALRNAGLRVGPGTGLLRLAKDNILNLAPGRYLPKNAWKNFHEVTTSVGRKGLAKAGGLGAVIDVGVVAVDYLKSGKSLGSAEFANDAGRAGAKGVAKGVAGAIIVGKSTAMGAAIGSTFPVVGTAVGGAAGFVVGVGLSMGADELIESGIDAVWK